MSKIFKKKFDTSSLYCCTIGVFKNECDGKVIHGEFDEHICAIMQELSTQEITKYLKSLYGGYRTDLPKYQSCSYTSIRYFRSPKNPKVILPFLTLNSAMRSYEMPYIKGIFVAEELERFCPNPPNKLTLEEIADAETQIFGENKNKKSGKGNDTGDKSFTIDEKLDKLFEK